MALGELAPTGTTLPLLSADDWRETRELTAAWLLRLSPRTRDGYQRDLLAWLEFCDRRSLDPRGARLRDADLFGAWSISEDNPRRLAASSTARRMAAVSSWYTYLVRNEHAERNPFKDSTRPKVDADYSATEWLDESAARRIITAAAASSGTQALRNVAMVRLMLELGIRVTEVVALPLSALGHSEAYRTVTVRGKGNKRVKRVVPPDVGAAIDAYLQLRADREGKPVSDLAGLLFVTASGRQISRNDAFHLVRRFAKRAGIPNADRITPHSLRHSFATIATKRGATLEDLQEAMCHADPRTTRRYQRAVGRLERDPSQLVAAALG